MCSCWDNWKPENLEQVDRQCNAYKTIMRMLLKVLNIFFCCCKNWTEKKSRRRASPSLTFQSPLIILLLWSRGIRIYNFLFGLYLAEDPETIFNQFQSVSCQDLYLPLEMRSVHCWRSLVPDSWMTAFLACSSASAKQQQWRKRNATWN